MANPEHVEVVKQGTQALRAWRSRNARERLDLSGADLTVARIVGTDMSKATGLDLRGADLSQADLSGAKLSGVDVSQADAQLAPFFLSFFGRDNPTVGLPGGPDLNNAKLSGANLAGADLWQAHLLDADLGAADLSGANLSNSQLGGASFAGANLTDVSFRHAILSVGTNLREAVLTRTDFTEAEWGMTLALDVDLSTAIGLETIAHNSPSTISAETLRRSRGCLPEEFLKGVGLASSAGTIACRRGARRYDSQRFEESS